MSGDAYSERTFIMVKPDGVQRGLIGKIIKRFEEKGFKLVAMKFMWVSDQRSNAVINTHNIIYEILSQNMICNNTFKLVTNSY